MVSDGGFSPEASIAIADAMAARVLDNQQQHDRFVAFISHTRVRRIPGPVQTRVLRTQARIFLPSIEDPDVPFSQAKSAKALNRDITFFSGMKAPDGRQYRDAIDKATDEAYAHPDIGDFQARRMVRFLGAVQELAATNGTEPATIVSTDDTFRQAERMASSPEQEAALWIALGGAAAQLLNVRFLFDNSLKARELRRYQTRELEHSQEAHRQRGMHRVLSLWGMEGWEGLPAEQYDALQNQGPLVPEVEQFMGQDS